MKKEYIKIIDGEILRTSVDDSNEKMVSNVLADGFVELAVSEIPTNVLASEFHSMLPKYTIDGNTASLNWEEKLDSKKVTQRIRELTTQLSATDYKVVKNHEYIDAGLEPYYNPTELYSEREPLRQQIRELETLLDT